MLTNSPLGLAGRHILQDLLLLRSVFTLYYRMNKIVFPSFFSFLLFRVKMNGKVKNFVLSGTYAHEEAKTPGGYWVMWPMRVYWKYRL